MSNSGFGEATPFAHNFDQNLLSPAQHEAVTQMISGTHHNMVPLVWEETRARVLDQGLSGWKVEGVAAYSFRPTPEGDVNVDDIVVPPADMTADDFLALSNQLAKPVMREMNVDMNGTIMSLLKTGTFVGTGISKFVDIANPATSFSALHVPHAFIREGLAAKRPDETLDELSTSLTASLFDWLVSREK